MTKVFLSLHVLAAVIAVGPVAVAASAFPRALRTAWSAPSDAAEAALRTLHRICRVYGAVAVTVLMIVHPRLHHGRLTSAASPGLAPASPPAPDIGSAGA